MVGIAILVVLAGIATVLENKFEAVLTTTTTASKTRSRES